MNPSNIYDLELANKITVKTSYFCTNNMHNTLNNHNRK